MRKIYRINAFAKRIGRPPSTIRRWDREGVRTAKRLPSGHRYVDELDVLAMLGGAPEKRLTVVYCRVSSAGQRDDLVSQIAAMEQNETMDRYRSAKRATSAHFVPERS